MFSGVPGTGKSTLAEAITKETQAALLNWDWMMSALRVFPEVWAAAPNVDTRRNIGYELMSRMIESRLRLGQSSITDCVARPRALSMWSDLAARHGASFFVIECFLDDAIDHKSRITGRTRNIPGWDELDWNQVAASRSSYEPLPEPKLLVDAAHSIDHNLNKVRTYLGLTHD